MRSGKMVRAALVHAGATIVMTAGLGLATSAEARITKIQIDSTQSPTFEGRQFGSVGAYEKLRGKAFGELDPNAPENKVITDIGLAPKVGGKVQYSMDIYILKPVNLASGNRKLFMEVNNRGGKLFGPFNRSGGGNNPSTAVDAGDAFLMNQGYSLAWNGWDISAASGGDRLTITVPVAKNADGSSITGPSYEYIVFDNATTTTSTLAYAAASLDKTKATLTVKDRLNDAAVTIPSTGWEYVNDRSIRLLPAGTTFKQSAIYEFSYTAKDPLVAGIGFAATRDFVSFLRNAKADDFGNPNPLAGAAQTTYAYTVSQPGRYMNDFELYGFNRDESGKQVFDGLLNWIAGGDGVALNYRFSQPARTERNRQNHLYPEAPFPFAEPTLYDPITGKTAGRADRCRATNTCWKTFQVNSANEYWVKAGSLLHTDTSGNDLRDPDNARFFLLSSVDHTVGGGTPGSRGVCQQFVNTINPTPALRALFVALDEWVTMGVRPPRSQVPRVEDDNAVFSVPQSTITGIVPQSALGWPTIPGVTYTGVITTRYFLDFGPQFDQGIMTINPPVWQGRPRYPSFVSRVDNDGNDVAGIRLPQVEVPLGTYTGWGLRAAAFGGPDGCESTGQYIPFGATRDARLAAGDPRRSVEERYHTHDKYVQEVTKAAVKLQRQRFLLQEDVDRYVAEAEASNILK